MEILGGHSYNHRIGKGPRKIIIAFSELSNSFIKSNYIPNLLVLEGLKLPQNSLLFKTCKEKSLESFAKKQLGLTTLKVRIFLYLLREGYSETVRLLIHIAIKEVDSHL